VPENPYHSPSDTNDPPPSRWSVPPHAIVRGFLVFIAVSFLLAMVAHVVIPLDPALDPEIDAWRERVSNVVLSIVYVVSAVLGILECYRVSRRLRR
jgi:hypothetical protein